MSFAVVAAVVVVVLNLCCVQVQLKEYVKLNDTIYEVDQTEEECFKFSRVLNFKVNTIFTSCLLEE